MDELIAKFGVDFIIKNLAFPFYPHDALTRGTFISGGKEAGKTNLAKILTYLLKKKGCVIKVVDGSRAWLRNTPIKNIVKINSLGSIEQSPITESVVFDVSSLLPDNQAYFIGTLLERDFNFITSLVCQKCQHSLLLNQQNYTWYCPKCQTEYNYAWYCYWLEEAQLILRSGSLRARASQCALRMVTVGRNFKEAIGLLTQFPALIDTNTIKACGLAYFGRAWEQNDLRKLERLVSWTRSRCEDVFKTLGVGQFVFQKVGEDATRKIIRVPEFINGFNPISETQLLPQKKPSTSIFSKILGIE